MSADRAGEGALGVSEEMRFEQAFRNGAAIDRHERAVRTFRPVMQEARDTLFADARFAMDQRVAAAIGEHLGFGQQRTHWLGHRDQGLFALRRGTVELVQRSQQFEQQLAQVRRRERQRQRVGIFRRITGSACTASQS
ncbi:hypothetical protein G6F57_021909 [Rhizopus arrhizus]|nr:hypothetical protein G6F57_021909 [Rhizopus arrhizus]